MMRLVWWYCDACCLVGCCYFVCVSCCVACGVCLVVCVLVRRCGFIVFMVVIAGFVLGGWCTVLTVC